MSAGRLVKTCCYIEPGLFIKINSILTNSTLSQANTNKKWGLSYAVRHPLPREQKSFKKHPQHQIKQEHNTQGPMGARPHPADSSQYN